MCSRLSIEDLRFLEKLDLLEELNDFFVGVGLYEEYKKILITNNPITNEPTTILIEIGGIKKDVAIITLARAREYHTVQEFEKALDMAIKFDDKNEIKIFNFFPMTLPDARALLKAITEILVITGHELFPGIPFEVES